MVIEGDAAARAPGVGGKAASLGRLVEAGFDVPAFVVLPSGAAFDPAVLDRLGPGPFAVRSSGLAEDGVAHSHAGQYDTQLAVQRDDVAAAVAAIAGSGRGEGAAAYREARGLGADEAPAVIVQVMVAATVAGVAFSADPVSGRRDRIVVSAVAGLGDRLVAGEVDGSSWWIDRVTGAVCASTGNADLLSLAQRAVLVDLATRVEALAGCAQDIEWAFAGDRLHLLQARAITSALRDVPIADPGVAVFDNSNIVESYPGIVSPLTFSFAQYAYARVYMSFVALLGVRADRVAETRTVFENMLVRVDGRVYYNLGNWFRALALLPGYALNRGYMETMMGVGAPLPPAVAATIGGVPARGAARWREWARVAAVGFGLVRAGSRLPATARAFRTRLDRALAATTPERLATMAPTELAAEYRRIEGDLLDRWDAPIVNDFLCMIAFGASRKLLERWLGAEGLEIHNDLLIGQGDIVSARPPKLIRAMGRVAADDPATLAALAADDADALALGPIGAMLASYIVEFGDRCTEELKLESVTLDEDPRTLHAAVLAAAQAPGTAPPEPRDPLARLDRGLAGQPLRQLVVRPLLRWTRTRVRDRENLRYERTRLFGRARRVFLSIGHQFHAAGLIDAPRDVFLLTVDEVLGAIEGYAASANLAGIAAVRRDELARAGRLPDPPERILVHGPAYTAAGAVAPVAVADHAAERSGTGCSAGQALAVARVVRDPRGQRLAPGEILVARHTDPGWIALFASASAIVVERGSLLSHSAIVARELGIPCVVGLAGATDWIVDGEVIAVDGATGLVRRMAG
ncbi:PEP/pyruvate-binding domain-containing protein [Sphingomonas sp. Leaf231]|uniref:PEP/pyruvate-binding domain-containing protein n=1 Tax=Sphingomonas sp. Leaf231 TaxID=1736301 RepID=UPI000A514646|nr:PEP/pyruvate-binding domain-containing protein [Sphingomonas sp. Leaf231]